MTISMDTKYGLSLERLRSLLIYDPNTGVFTRKETGETAGYTQEGKGNYRRIGIDGRYYLEHRVAWFYVHGRWPSELDHVDGNGLNNKLTNLRECNRKENCGNRRACRNSKSRIKGIHWHKANSRWIVQIGSDRRYIGSYKTIDAAKEAYNVAAREYFGEFARYV